MSKKALVTGAAGFLGTNLVLELVEQGWEVFALSRSANPSVDWGTRNVTHLHADLRDRDRLKKIVPDNLDVIFHAGSLVSYWRARGKEQYQTNVEATKFLCELALEKNVKRFIHTSTILTYDFSSWERITEETPLTGEKSWVGYIRTKRQGEMEVERAIDRMVDDCYNWMVKTGRLKARA